MTKQALIMIGFLLILAACQSTKEEEERKNLVSKEHASLIGTWEEKDSVENITWIFGQYEVKWRGFTHFYRVSGDSLIISGMVYRILDQSDKKVKILKLNGKACTFNRKD